jgi:hypothetical protein
MLFCFSMIVLQLWIAGLDWYCLVPSQRHTLSYRSQLFPAAHALVDQMGGVVARHAIGIGRPWLHYVQASYTPSTTVW